LRVRANKPRRAGHFLRRLKIRKIAFPQKKSGFGASAVVLWRRVFAGSSAPIQHLDSACEVIVDFLRAVGQI